MLHLVGERDGGRGSSFDVHGPKCEWFHKVLYNLSPDDNSDTYPESRITPRSPSSVSSVNSTQSISFHRGEGATARTRR